MKADPADIVPETAAEDTPVVSDPKRASCFFLREIDRVFGSSTSDDWWMTFYFKCRRRLLAFTRVSPVAVDARAIGVQTIHARVRSGGLKLPEGLSTPQVLDARRRCARQS